jgi:hypothetical protein
MDPISCYKSINVLLYNYLTFFYVPPHLWQRLTSTKVKFRLLWSIKYAVERNVVR